MGVTNYVLTGMILQVVGGWGFNSPEKKNMRPWKKLIMKPQGEATTEL